MGKKRAAQRWSSLSDGDAQQRGGLDVVQEAIHRKEKAMRNDDSRYWELFENRPAQERTSRLTSPNRAEEALRDRHKPIDGKRGAERVTPRECVKC